MLTLVTGRAKSGKTQYIMSAIRDNVEKGRGGNILLVPEQYSHQTTRALSEFCGDRLSLYGEVLTFSLLADRVFAETGGLSETLLDEGGRLLVMNLAFSSVQPSLKVYGSVALKSEFLLSLLSAVDELKSCCITTDELMSESVPEGTLRDKLRDIALIGEAFDAIMKNNLQDPSSRLDRLAEKIGKSSIGNGGEVFIDGFSDFTAQEIRIIDELINKGAKITISLPEGDEDVFRISANTKRRLVRLADMRGVKCSTISLNKIKGVAEPELDFLDEKLFKTETVSFEGENCAVRLIAAETPDSECAIAASELIRLVRDEGYRWRELAVTARGFEKYEAIVENVFGYYGVPIFLNRRSDILQKPVLSLVTAALDAVNLGWDYDSMFRYLKTGLAGLTPDECDMLENYVLKWNIRGAGLWSREEPWTFSPRGFASEFTDMDKAELDEINRLRRKAALPLKRFHDASKSAGTAAGHVRALYSFTEDIGLAERLQEKSMQFRRLGYEKTAAEYLQLWDILVRVMEQCMGILGDMPMDSEEFSRLFKLVLSRYDVATIPVTLDAVSAGDMTRMRSGSIKCLVVLGATDDALPMVTEGYGILNDAERERMLELGFELTGSTEDRVLREMQTIYSSLAMPTKRLMLTYPKTVGGTKKRPSYIIRRIEALLNIAVCDEKSLGGDYRTAAEAPCFEAAVSGDTPFSAALRACFERSPDKSALIDRVRLAAQTSRGSLAARSVESIYGRKLRLSASRVDRFYSCKFSYFMQYGLKAKPRKKAEFDSPEMGTFLHFVLENVISELRARGALKKAERSEYLALTERYVRQYADERLGGLEGKSGRFKYLFERLVKDVYSIIDDMVDELKSSDFTPLSFELEFGKGDVPAASVRGGDTDITVVGIVDRVDGWLHNGKLYLRVVDYKTGKKSFDLSDVWYGLGIQMLIYLFTLEKHGAKLYGHNIVPAGVLYAPARDVFLSLPRSASEEEIRKERSRKLVRSGLLLNDGEVLRAMEKGENKYLPLRFTKDGIMKPDNLASLEQLGRLGRHIERTLERIGIEIQKGNISADPFLKAGTSPCDYCDFALACQFDEKTDKRRRLKRLRPDDVWRSIDGGGCKP